MAKGLYGREFRPPSLRHPGPLHLHPNRRKFAANLTSPYARIHNNNREGIMNEICAAARALAVILAIVSAFVSVPLTAPLLLIFGGIAAIRNDSEKNTRNFIITIVLLLGAKTLEVLPVVGPHLAAIFTSLGIAF